MIAGKNENAIALNKSKGGFSQGECKHTKQTIIIVFLVYRWWRREKSWRRCLRTPLAIWRYTDASFAKKQKELNGSLWNSGTRKKQTSTFSQLFLKKVSLSNYLVKNEVLTLHSIPLYYYVVGITSSSRLDLIAGILSFYLKLFSQTIQKLRWRYYV